MEVADADVGLGAGFFDGFEVLFSGGIVHHENAEVWIVYLENGFQAGDGIVAAVPIEDDDCNVGHFVHNQRVIKKLVKDNGNHYWDLIWVLAKTDFKMRYQGSVLGFLWALLKPLFVFLILNLVFSELFASDVPFYSLQLLTGILLWNYFAEGTMVGLTSLSSKAHLLRKIVFPRWAVVVAASLQSLMTFAVTMLILLGALLVFQVPLSVWQMALFGGYLVMLYLLVLGFSFVASVLFVRFRDWNQIWEVLLLGGFYAAPIIYPMSILPQGIQSWLYLNPMTFLIQHSKSVLFLGDFSRLDHHLLYLLVLFVFFLGSLWVFLRYQARVIELL